MGKKLKISYIQDSQSLGAAKSFWKLILNAPEADFYAFIDQDDVWDNDKLETALQEIKNNDEPTIWFSNCRIIDKNGVVVNEQLRKENPILTIPSQLICGSAQGCSMVFNKKVINYIRSKEIEYIPMHDIVLMIYILSIGKIIYESKPYFSYRVHENNVVAKQGKNIIKKILSTINLWFGHNNISSISKFSSHILKDNFNNMDEITIDYLKTLLKCKKSFICRMKILNNPLTISTNKRGLKSFKIRVLLGII